MSRASASGTSAFRIFLTNEQQLFYQPGEWLEGAVTLSQFQRIPARAVRLKFRGRERARWPAEALSGEVFRFRSVFRILIYSNLLESTNGI